jgi:hypothetical protein
MVMQLLKTLAPCCAVLQQVFASVYLFTEPNTEKALALVSCFKNNALSENRGQMIVEG